MLFTKKKNKTKQNKKNKNKTRKKKKKMKKKIIFDLNLKIADYSSNVFLLHTHLSNSI